MPDIELTRPPLAGGEHILSEEALAFVADLQRRFGARRDDLLAERRRRGAEVARTGSLDFLSETADVRAGSWQVAAAPSDLQDRRVEITGPTDRKMAINALNSGARVWLADLEDANTPHWDNVVGGQVTLYDAVRRSITFISPEGRRYTLRDPDTVPVIVARPRGWHFDEAHVLVDSRPAVAALVDFGLYFFHNAAELLRRGTGPYFYLPKLESHLEARLWNDVFTHAQESLGVPVGTIRATVLIETIWAAFEMEEILYELREHASGLNAGRWDYLFSMIKTFRDAPPASPGAVPLPDRNAVTMDAPMMKAYADLLVATCHRRGTFAIGGMAAFIPSRRDPEVNAAAFAKVREDKAREVAAGFDGSWVAHPDLVPVAQQVFDEALGDRPNQLDHRRDDVSVTSADLLALARTPGTSSEAGLRANVSVGIRYVAAWLGGSGAVGIDNLMEDAATAEIARSQIWQWVHSGHRLDDGQQVTRDLVERVLAEECTRLEGLPGLERARALFEQSALDDDFVDFLTLPAYAAVLADEQ